GDRPLKEVEPSDQRMLSKLSTGRSTIAVVRAGAAFVTCRQVANGAGQGMPPQSSQWLHGCSPVAACCEVDGLAGAAAATVMKLLARTARQPRMAARA